MGNALSWVTDNLAEDERQGEARDENQPQSLWSMVNTLIPALIISTVCLFIFLTTRRPQRRFYAPRSVLGSLPEKERSPELPDGLFSWFMLFWRMPDIYALRHQGLDAYLFLRYLRICLAICFVSLCITWPVLFPLHITGGNGREQLELISYSNINIVTSSARLYAHALLAWVVYGFVMYMITRECIFYINLRQAFLLSPRSSKRVSSRTVLFTCVPSEYLDAIRIRQIFGSSKVKNVWMVGDTTELDGLVQKRDALSMRLERAELSLIRKVNRKHLRELKKSGGHVICPEDLDKGLRSTRRDGFLGLFGKKVDSIRWYRAELERLITDTEAAQEKWQSGDFKKAPAVFVEFHTLYDAQLAFEGLTHHTALSMSPKLIGVRPTEIIWRNMTVPWWQIIIRQYIVYAFVGALIIFWAIPVGVIGIAAQISVLQSLPFLVWMKELPDQIMGIISGLLPGAALAIAMMVVPAILRFCARTTGLVAESQVELFVQNAFFLFQLIQVFLIRTVTDTASAALVSIVQEPTRVFGILSEALPTSSNFYISYFIVEGLMIGVDVLTQVVKCVIFKIVFRIWSRNPRKMFVKWTTLESISWGSTLPVYTGIVIISITYAVIAPFLLFWATVGIWIFYQAYRYNILFVSDTQVNTHGLIYPRALKQLFAGLYLAEICMVGMFAVSQAPGQAALMIILLVFTLLYHITLNRALDPLLYRLPRTLQSEEEIHQQRQNSDLEASTPESDGDDRTVTPSDQGSLDDRRVLQNGNFLARFLKPWVYADYWQLRNLVPQHEGECEDDVAGHGATELKRREFERNPYWPPSVTSPPPLLWISKDPMGLSKREIEETGKVIPITDDGCTLSDKIRLEWDMIRARPPIWEGKVYY